MQTATATPAPEPSRGATLVVALYSLEVTTMMIGFIMVMVIALMK